MTIGSENDDVSFMAMVESVGSTIVIDDQCSGTRYFWNEARMQDDPIATIADRYCERPACPTKDYPAHTRFDHVLKLAKDYNARGGRLPAAEILRPARGRLSGPEAHLEANGIPTLFLEFDITNPLGPFRIRIEAFLETLGEEELF
jgi:benzoyl-CoA reductase subunit C